MTCWISALMLPQCAIICTVVNDNTYTSVEVDRDCKRSKKYVLVHNVYVISELYSNATQWRSEGNRRPGANLNFAPPPLKKIPKKLY